MSRLPTSAMARLPCPLLMCHWIISILVPTASMGFYPHGFVIYLIFMAFLKLYCIVKTSMSLFKLLYYIVESFLLRQTHENNNVNFKKLEECPTHPTVIRPSWTRQQFVDLAEISIWERPVDNLRVSYPSGKVKGSGPLKHDYVIIKIKLASGNIESFMVEKVAKPVKFQMCDLPSEFHVKYTEGGLDTGAACRFKQELHGARVPVLDLLSHLLSGIPEYDIMLMNCWSYAHYKTGDVIRLCERDVDLKNGEKASLKAGLQSLENVKHIDPFFYILLGLFIVADWIITPTAMVLLPSWAGQKSCDHFFPAVNCIAEPAEFIRGNLFTALWAHIYINHPSSVFRWRLHSLERDLMALVLFGRGSLFVAVLSMLWRGTV